ncbi:MAG TPA: glycoside hydrolase family 44 protein [Anaerolineae bacterium]
MKCRFFLHPSAFILLLLAACTAPAPTATIVPTESLPPTVTPLPTFTPAPTAVPDALYVDAAQPLGPISPLVYGTNYGPWIAVPYDLLDEAIDARITYLRFPGGNWGDRNELQTYQVDFFITLARQMDSEPSFSVRLLDGTPEKAAYWVKYCRDKGYNIRYWSIGNEPDLYRTEHQEADYDTLRFNREWRAIAEAMKAVDPNLLLIGPDLSGGFTANPATNPKDANGRDWLTEFLRANGDLVDIVAIHRYPFPKTPSSPSATIEDLRNNSREWDELIPYVRSLTRETTGRDLPIAVTEVNSDWSKNCCNDAAPDSFYNAIWWADSLGRMIRNGVSIVAHFVLQSSPAVGAVGLLGNYEVRPSYYVYQMYKRFGDQLLYASSDDPDVSLFAAQRADGALTLMLINLAPDPITKPLRLNGFTPKSPAAVWRFDAGHNAELIDSQPTEDGTPITLPGQSLTLFILSP